MATIIKPLLYIVNPHLMLPIGSAILSEMMYNENNVPQANW